VFRDFLDVKASPSNQPAENGNSISPNRWNLRLRKACHRLKPVGSLYDELYFQYCQRLASPPPPSLDALRCFPSADVIVERACVWIENLGRRPFFLWLHLMDPHAPYYPPQRALEQMGDDGIAAGEARYLNSYWNRGDLRAQRLARHRSHVIELYDAGIRWVDTQVARLVSTLRELGVWSNCLMALTADHGEEFLDHGGRYHPPNKLTEELVRVPLLLRLPGVGEKKDVETPFSLLHTAPTLLDALNIAIPGSFCGRSYLTQLRTGESWNGEAFAECVRGCTNPFVVETRLGPRILAVRESRFKLVLDFASANHSLFDLLHDPRERSPLPANAEKQVRARLLEKARRHVSRSLNLRGADHVLAMRLRDLQLELAQPAIAMCA
jgi:arylsulfatase A-like enzyme